MEADCGEAALKKYEENDGDFDIAILDVMMPGINGFEVCKELRNRNGGIGIIMLSAKTQEMDKVTGLMLGADDYVAKPFSPSELLARVDSLYRRVALAQSRSENNFKEELKSGEFILNLRNRALLKNGKMIELTQVEFQIMEYFFSNPNTALDRIDILNHVWGDAYVSRTSPPTPSTSSPSGVWATSGTRATDDFKLTQSTGKEAGNGDPRYYETMDAQYTERDFYHYRADCCQPDSDCHLCVPEQRRNTAQRGVQ